MTHTHRRGRLRLPLLGLIVGLSAGCTSVPVREQGRVSKPNMVFADTGVFGYDSSIVTQLEPGASTTGGAQAGGCTSCK